MARQLIGALAVAVVLLAACGESAVYDTAALEADLPAAVLPEAPDLVSDVRCEDPLPVEAESVRCSLVVVDTPTTVDAVVTDAGAVSADLDLAVLAVADVGDELGARLESDLGTGAVVACDRPVVRVVEIGEQIRCLVTDPGGTTRTFVAEIVDLDGRFEVELEP